MKSKGNHPVPETFRPGAARQAVPFPQRRRHPERFKPPENDERESVGGDSNENEGAMPVQPRLNNVVPFHRPGKGRLPDSNL
jgi:hypothetical protein